MKIKLRKTLLGISLLNKKSFTIIIPYLIMAKIKINNYNLKKNTFIMSTYI